MIEGMNNSSNFQFESSSHELLNFFNPNRLRIICLHTNSRDAIIDTLRNNSPHFAALLSQTTRLSEQDVHFYHQETFGLWHKESDHRNFNYDGACEKHKSAVGGAA